MPHPDEDRVARLSKVGTRDLPEDGGERYNRLIFSPSPYLLQHAENPVDWHPWSEDAFRRAAEEDKPVFLSIGYSTCHWCHVMEEESFEDSQVADVLNRHYIPVKVDREERPDIDNTYMAVCQMMTGSGGWPLNLVLSPDKNPFFAATYIPREPRMGMTGLIPLLEKIAQLWREDRARLLQTGKEAARALLQLDRLPGETRTPDEGMLQKALQTYRTSFDSRYGGFNTPKFPAPHNLSLLLRIGLRSDEGDPSAMALKTLQQIRLGGIFDQIGLGIHRYSVDERWLVPHFEKMLYDQALAALAYLDAFQFTGEAFYGQAAAEVLEYVLRDLGHEEGGFYCGEDADSEGAEGTFYLWTPSEVEEVLGKEAGAVFCRSYGITEEGNFEGKSIPHLPMDIGALAAKVGVDAGQLSDLLAESRRKLFAAREQRIRPHLDDKILTGWNGLAVAALARAGAVLGETKWVDAARKTVDFLLARLKGKDGRLLRRFRRGTASIPGFLEDYAFLAWGLIELYQAAFDTRHLRAALELTEQMEDLFGDGSGGLFDTGADAEKVLTRGRSLQDGAIPSGASAATFNLLRLGRLTGREELAARGERLLCLNLPQIEQYPSAYAQSLIALDYVLGPTTEVAIAQGENEETATEMAAALRRGFRPRLLVLLHRAGDEDLPGLAPLLEGKSALQGKSTAYLCRNQSCRASVTETAALENQLGE